MAFQQQAAFGKIPSFLLLFLSTQFIPRLALASLTAVGWRAIALEQAVASQPVHQSQSTESLCPAQLGTAIETIINRPHLRRTHWGILIKPLSPINPNQSLYSREANRYFIAASNVKLLTTAAALQQLGAEFRIRTSIYDTGAGVLRVVGRGDPSLSAAQLKELAQQLKRQGVQVVQQLVVDDSYFQGDAINPTWEWEDVQADYGTAVNSLILHQNAVELTLSPQQLDQPLKATWSDPIAGLQWQIDNRSVTAQAGVAGDVEVSGVLGKPTLQITGQLASDAEPESFGLAILDPAAYFLQHLDNALEAEGIRVINTLIEASGVGGQFPKGREVAGVVSPPLADLLVEINQDSNNLYAEVLLRTLGAATDTNATETGLNTIKATLTALGVEPESYVLVDGSGLSRRNLVSPEAIAQTLQRMAQTPESQIYRASLPVAGISGTLRRRFRDTKAQGIVQAKTGTLTGISALSGYIDVPTYQPLVFSILVNQSDQSAAILRQAIDEIVLLLTRLHSC